MRNRNTIAITGFGVVGHRTAAAGMLHFQGFPKRDLTPCLRVTK